MASYAHCNQSQPIQLLFWILSHIYQHPGILTGHRDVWRDHASINSQGHHYVLYSFRGTFGALIGKKLIYVFSRRNYILFINGWGIMAGCLIFITHYECLIIMRIIQGACVGMYTAIIPMNISEISPIEISGSTGLLPKYFAQSEQLQPICFITFFQLLLA